ncbi:hypothetical protein EIP86_000567 [Pleurotus ostreatoroseus]|nr:hypothetical protein EIP86_000567 [Pleurotus ostreatoroseus]
MSFTIPTKQKALVIPAAHAPFEVQETDVPQPGAGDVLIRAESVGLNPFDWKVQEYDPFKSKYPLIFGCEAAGTVVQSGAGVTSLAVGDKVLHAAWIDYPAFQQYNLAPADLCVKVPSNLTLDQAASVPQAFDTALIGLYCHPENNGGANLTPFWRDGGRGKYAEQPILVLGGSASISQPGKLLDSSLITLSLINDQPHPAIQFARLSGFSPIITTASLKNTSFLTSLGATHVLDRNLSAAAFTSAVRDILAGKPLRLVYEGVSDVDIQRAAFELLAPEGQYIGGGGADGLSPEQRNNKEKQFISPYGSPFMEDRRQMCVSFYKQLTPLLESGELKPNNIEVLSGGWNGAIAGLKRMKEGGVSAQKLVVHPFDTV